MISVEAYNRSFPRSPRMSGDAGWIHGVWYLGGFRTASLHGQYPAGFLERTLALFPGAREILHCPSGTVSGPGVTVDRIRDGVRRPMVVADAGSLPFRDRSFEIVLADPPYTPADSRKYGCAPFPMRRAMAEWGRVVCVAGHVAILHTHVPQFRRREWEIRGLVAVVTGTNRAARVLTILRRRGPAGLPFLCSLCSEIKDGRPRWWNFAEGERQVCGRCRGELFRSSRGSGRDTAAAVRKYVRSAT